MIEMKITGHENVVEIINKFELELYEKTIPATCKLYTRPSEHIFMYVNKQDSISAIIWKDVNTLEYIKIKMNINGTHHNLP